ncbi:MAG: hypothetical protein MJ118_04370 [Clostridia bacterium]|nr:hypothetical protein [Clostridia bacterium]
MIQAILYSSSTGHTKQYAEMLAAKTGLPVFAYGQQTLAPGTEVIYLGWLMAGSVVGLKQAMKNYSVLCVIATGMSPVTEKQHRDIRKKHSLSGDCELFYLQGGLDLQKIPAPQRAVLKLICKSAAKALEGKERTASEEETYLMATSVHSSVKEENLQPVLDWYQTL